MNVLLSKINLAKLSSLMPCINKLVVECTCCRMYLLSNVIKNHSVLFSTLRPYVVNRPLMGDLFISNYISVQFTNIHGNVFQIYTKNDGATSWSYCSLTIRDRYVFACSFLFGPHSPTKFAIAFLRSNLYEFRLKFQWSLFLKVQLTIFQHWFG